MTDHELSQVSDNELVSRMEKLVRTERKITHLILNHIAEIEDRKIFAKLGYGSMYSYLTQKLGYSGGSASRRLDSARLLRKVPDVSLKIEDGSLNLSQLSEVHKHVKRSEASGNEISVEDQFHILEKLENKNNYETERFLAKTFDLPIQSHEIIKPQRDDSVRIEITLTQEQFQELEQAKSLLSHICHDGNWAGVIATLAKTYNSKKLKGRSTNAPVHSPEPKFSKNQAADADMIKRLTATPTTAGRINTAEPTTQCTSATGRKLNASSRRYISAHIKRFLLRKADNCCEFVNHTTKQRCRSKYKLQIDHIQPWAYGGSDSPENLRVLCQTHNNLRNTELRKTS